MAQLLKHMLALARTEKPWTLCCLWYDVPGPVADAYRRDQTRFAAQIGGDASHFNAHTYQEIFTQMERMVGAEDADYITYLRDRYLNG